MLRDGDAEIGYAVLMRSSCDQGALERRMLVSEKVKLEIFSDYV